MGITLEKLLEKVDYKVVKGTLDLSINDVIYDSRKVSKDVAFVCMSGAVVDGHKFISDAISKGASAIIVEKDVEIEEPVTVICVSSTRKALALMSAAYFGYPATKMTTIGITGTKGKTTTSHMIRTVLERAEKKYGIIGTIGTFINGKKWETENTTPESYELQKFFHQMVEENTEYMVMEVSSQGIKLDRTAGIHFNYGIFENISPDHIGPTEHKDFAEYLECKSRLFSQCDVGIVNGDDEHWKEIVAKATCQVKTFGTSQSADFCATNIEHVTQGGDLSMKFHAKGLLEGDIIVGLPGRFNIYNAMSCAAVCALMGLPKEDILHALEHVHVQGRVESMTVSDDFSVLIDYAHNEVSSRSILTTLREYKPNRIVSVFGCGGNRAKMRRYTMGEAIGELSDLSIITEDNSRLENVMDIIEDIKVGMHKTSGKYVVIPNRQEAITYAIAHAQKGDMIILLGKGHEEYMDYDGKKHPYSERQAVANAVKEIFGKDINI